MPTHTIPAAMLAAFALAATDYASAAHAAGAVQGTTEIAGSIRGTQEQITFEGLTRKKKDKGVPNGYDGLNWAEVLAEGKIFAQQNPAAKAVIHNKVVAVDSFQGDGSEAKLTAPTGTFSLKSGHFASRADGTPVTFSAYRNGTLVGSMATVLDPVDTNIVFDSTFARVDQVVITTAGSGTQIAMDNLIVRF
jgi:hypothetical protein